MCLFCASPLVSGYNDSRVNGTGMQICLKCRKDKLGITTNKQMADYMLSQNTGLSKDELYKKMNIRETVGSAPLGVADKYSGKPQKSAMDKELFSMRNLINECVFSSKPKYKKAKGSKHK